MEYTVSSGNLAIALLHHPVYDKNRQIVTTSVTNLDLHDIARMAKTFGLNRYFVVTPVQEQQKFVGKITGHWTEGWGAGYNPKRKAALELISLVSNLAEAVESLRKETDKPVKIVVTGAQPRPDSISYSELREKLSKEDASYLLVLGTGWGLTEEVFDSADFVLEPIRGAGDYNHLSVRSAAAIMVDRLIGR